MIIKVVMKMREKTVKCKKFKSCQDFKVGYDYHMETKCSSHIMIIIIVIIINVIIFIMKIIMIIIIMTIIRLATATTRRRSVAAIPRKAAMTWPNK